MAVQLRNRPIRGYYPKAWSAIFEVVVKALDGKAAGDLDEFATKVIEKNSRLSLEAIIEALKWWRYEIIGDTTKPGAKFKKKGT